MDTLKQGLAHEDTTWSESDYSWDQHNLVATKLTEDSDQQCQNGTSAPVLWREATATKQSKGKHTKGKGPMYCQVEGCGKDLNYEKDYYQRYRVCEQHLKMPSLVVDGQPSRFCQQCGRFQALTEFDDNKKSCRQRLLQHNVRRRKRVPGAESKVSLKSGRKRQQRHLSLKLEPGSPDSLGMVINQVQQATSGSGAALESSDKSSSISMDARSNPLVLPVDHTNNTASMSQISQDESLPITGTEQGGTSEQHSSLKPDVSCMDADPITSPFCQADDTSMGTSVLQSAAPSRWRSSSLLLPHDSCQIRKARSEWEMGSTSHLGMPPVSSCILPDAPMHCQDALTDDTEMLGKAVLGLLGHPEGKVQPSLQMGSSRLHLGGIDSAPPCTPTLLDGFLPELDLPDGRGMPMEEHMAGGYSMRHASAHSFGNDCGKLDLFPPVSHADLSAQSRGGPKRLAMRSTVFDNFGFMPSHRGGHTSGGMSQGGSFGPCAYTSPSLVEPTPFPMEMNHKVEQLSHLSTPGPHKDSFSPHDLDFLPRSSSIRHPMDALPPAILEAQLLREESTLDQMYCLQQRQKLSMRMMPDLMEGDAVHGAGFLGGMPQLPNSPRLTSHMKGGQVTGGFGLYGPSMQAPIQLTSDLSLQLPTSSKQMLHSHSGSSTYGQLHDNVSGPPVPSMSSYDMAKMMVSGGGSSASFSSETSLHSLSVKLLNMRPEELPPNMRLRLQKMLAAGSVSLHGAMRHGCIHLELDIVHENHPDNPHPSATAVEISTVQNSLGRELLKDRVVMVQLDRDIIIMENGELKLQAVAEDVVPDLPVLSSAEPLCVMAGMEVEVTVLGKSLLAEGTCFFARMQGMYKPLKMRVVQRADGSGQDVVRLTISDVGQGGLLTIMCQKDSVLSSSVTVLAVADALMYAELSQLLPALPRAQQEMLVIDLGEVLVWQSIQQEAAARRSGGRPRLPTHDSASELMGHCHGPEHDPSLGVDEGLDEEEDEAEDETGREDQRGEKRSGGIDDEEFEDGDVIDDDEAEGLEADAEGGPVATPALSASVVQRADTAHEDYQQHPLLTEEYMALARRIALNCLLFLCDRGMSVTAEVVLKALLGGRWSYSEVLMATATDGLTLLHRGVRSGSLSMVDKLLQWNDEHKTTWSWGLEGQMGLTPLHLAAVLGPDSHVAEHILSRDIGACYMWMTTKSHDSLTPSDLAKQAGAVRLESLAVKRLEFLIEGHSHFMSGMPRMSSRSRSSSQSGGSRSPPGQRQPQPQGQQQVASVHTRAAPPTAHTRQQQHHQRMVTPRVKATKPHQEAENQSSATDSPTPTCSGLHPTPSSSPGIATASTRKHDSPPPCPASPSPSRHPSAQPSTPVRTQAGSSQPIQTHVVAPSGTSGQVSPPPTSASTAAATSTTCEVEALDEASCSSIPGASTTATHTWHPSSSSNIPSTLPAPTTSHSQAASCHIKPPSRKCARLYHSRRQQEMQLTITTEALTAAYALCFISFLLALVSEMPLLQYAIIACCTLMVIVHMCNLTSLLMEQAQRLPFISTVVKLWRQSVPIPVAHHPFLLLFRDTALEESFVQHLSLKRSYKESMVSVVLAGVVAGLPVVLNRLLKLDLTSSSGGILHASLSAICHVPHIWLCLLLSFPVLAMVSQKAWYQSNHDAILLLVQLLSVMLVRTGSASQTQSHLGAGVKVVVSSALSLVLASTLRVRFKLQLGASLWEMISGLLVCASLPQAASARYMGIKMMLSSLTIAVTYAWERADRSKFTQDKASCRKIKAA